MTEDKEPSKWISVNDYMPEPEKPVLLLCEIRARGRCVDRYQCIGFHVPDDWCEEDSDYDWEFNELTYDEKRDEYKVNECFCEKIYNWDDLACVVINNTVTHWMPLPEPPKEKYPDQRKAEIRR